jgi:hypothetical protein
MRKKEISSNMLSPNAAGYASFLDKRSEEFKKIADSGYGLFWFPQCFYLYWYEYIKLEGFELWGNMGPHYSSSIASQFSEVMVVQDKTERIYKSNIFILTLLGGERRIKKELYEIKNNIYKNKELLPFKVFLIRFDRLVVNEKDHNAFEPDTFFKNLEWAPSLKANLWTRLHSVSIGVLEGNFQSCKEKFLDEKTLS